MIPRERKTILCLDECIESYNWSQSGSITVSVGFGFIEPDGTFTNAQIQQPETYSISGPDYKEVISNSKDGSINVDDLWKAVDRAREKVNSKRRVTFDASSN